MMEEEIPGLYGHIKKYWKMIPTHHTRAYSVDKGIADIKTVKTLTISKSSQNWKDIFNCPELEELHLDQPSHEQVQAVSNFIQLKRLRIKEYRAKDLAFIKNLVHLEEVALEYVSGFSDLSPLQDLPNLRSLHLENLRKVSDFGGLKGIKGLKYLLIDGTLDWKQPIDNFSFLEGLPDLEILSLMFVTSRAAFPAFLPALQLKNILEIRIPAGIVTTEEYAFLDAALPHVKKGYQNEASWPLYSMRAVGEQEYAIFLGKGEGKVKLNRSDAKDAIEDYQKKYELYRQKSLEIIKNYYKMQ